MIASSCWRHWYVILITKRKKKNCRNDPRLTKTAEHTVFGLPKGTQNFGKGVVDADSSHLQSAFVDLKMMTWTYCVCFIGMLRCDGDCCLHHFIEAVLSPCFQSRLICVCGIFHVVTDTQPKITSRSIPIFCFSPV